MKSLVLSVLFGLLSSQSYAGSVTGRVVDNCSKAPIKGALVVLNKSAQAITNDNGEFKVTSATLSKSNPKALLDISGLGYFVQNEIIDLSTGDVKFPKDTSVINIHSDIGLHLSASGETVISVSP